MSTKNDFENCVGIVGNYILPAQTNEKTIQASLDRLQKSLEDLDDNLSKLFEKLVFVIRPETQVETKPEPQITTRRSDCVENIEQKTGYVETLNQLIIKTNINLDL